MVVCGHRGVVLIVGRERARPPRLSKRHGRPQRRHLPRTRGGFPLIATDGFEYDGGVSARLFGSACV